jgi:hypothetical protein
MTQIRFFSTGSDIRQMVDLVETRNQFEYWLHCNVETIEECKKYDKGSLLPNIDKAAASASVSCDAYVVCDVAVGVRVREMTGARGERRFLVDQLINPDSVSFCPAGLHISGALLEGRVGTASASPEARRLMRVFRGAISKCFTRMEDVWIGDEALELFRRGARLTQAIDADEKFDSLRRRM